MTRPATHLGEPATAAPAHDEEPPGQSGASGVAADDSDTGWGEVSQADHEQWLHRQRPPHWE